MAWYRDSFTFFIWAKRLTLENSVLRIIFGPKRGRVMGRRKLKNKETHNLHPSPRIFKPKQKTWAGKAS
jgi:hypothetical protein